MYFEFCPGSVNLNFDQIRLSAKYMDAVVNSVMFINHFNKKTTETRLYICVSSLNQHVSPSPNSDFSNYTKSV